MTGDESGCHLRSQATAGRPQGGAARCCVPAFAAFAAQTPGHARTRQEWWALHQEDRPGAQHSGPPPSLTQTIGLHLGWVTPCLEVSRPKSGFATHQKVKMRIAEGRVRTLTKRKVSSVGLGLPTAVPHRTQSGWQLRRFGLCAGHGLLACAGWPVPAHNAPSYSVFTPLPGFYPCPI